MNKFNEIFASSRYLESGDYGCPTCAEGAKKTEFGISDGTDYELLKLDRANSEDFGGNEIFSANYPGAMGASGPRPPSSFPSARPNVGTGAKVDATMPLLVFGVAVAAVSWWMWKSDD